MRLTVFVLAILAVAVFAPGCVTAPQSAAPVARYTPAVQGPVQGSDQTPGSAARPGDASMPSDADTAGARDFALRPLRIGDRIVVNLLGSGNQSIETMIDESGQVTLPLIPAIELAGLSKSEAEQRIRKAYIDGQIYKQITVIIIPPELSFYVKGEVLRPGVFLLRASTKFLQALSQAGGFSEFANTKKIRVIRGNDTFYINYQQLLRDPEKDQVVQPGDLIDVPRSW